MCQPYQVTNVAGGTYTVQDDEWDSSAAQCVSTKGAAAFTVTRSEIANPADGDPGSYPSIYAGCNWGACTQGGLAAQPQQLGDLGPGGVTTTLATTDPPGGAYDVSYDIWTNRASTASGAPDGAEVMVWLNHHGGVQPAGDEVASGVKVGGYTYDVWYSTNAGNGPCVTYEMTTAHTEVANLDLVPLFDDAGQRGYLSPSWYLIAVEAGFEIWQGGDGTGREGTSRSRSGPPRRRAAARRPRRGCSAPAAQAAVTPRPCHGVSGRDRTPTVAWMYRPAVIGASCSRCRARGRSGMTADTIGNSSSTPRTTPIPAAESRTAAVTPKASSAISVR